MAKKHPPRSKTKTPPRQKYTAKTADKHVLYEKSVQDTTFDIKFISRIFKKERGRLPLTLREDFCGTAKLCADWVASNKERSAIGLDLDADTLAWGRRHRIEPLGERAKRVTLMQRNVLDGTKERSDVVVAFNFSYCIFKERQVLVRYFDKVRAGLNADGVFLMDMHGGTECFVELEEPRKLEGFTYVWDQEPFDPINGYGMRHIHFRFPDGTQLRKAFTYDWRIWHLTELRDTLKDAGFSRVDVYWEGSDGQGSGNGVFKRTLRAENEESFVAYLAAFP